MKYIKSSKAPIPEVGDTIVIGNASRNGIRAELVREVNGVWIAKSKDFKTEKEVFTAVPNPLIQVHKYWKNVFWAPK
jgi:hypothetical protein